MTQLCIGSVLDAQAITAILAQIEASPGDFQDGKLTAGWQARQVKNNEQLSSQQAVGILTKVEAAMLANPVFQAAARPKCFTKMLISRYSTGMNYGLHVDDPLMGGTRTDLSFTLFLKDPDQYQGGELVLEGADGDSTFKLPAGSMVVYPTTSLHRVAEVTGGQRIAIVGWVRSFFRSTEAREALFDLDTVLSALRQSGATREVIDRLLKIRANMTRLWAED